MCLLLYSTLQASSLFTGERELHVGCVTYKIVMSTVQAVGHLHGTVLG